MVRGDFVTLILQSGERRSLRDLGVTNSVDVTLYFLMSDLHVAVLALDDQRHLLATGVVSQVTPALLDGAVTGTFAEGQACFVVTVPELPREVRRLVLVAGHDERPVAQAQALTVHLGGHTFEPLPLLKQEQAVVLLELYATASGWRVAAIGHGYQGGWEELLKAFAASSDQITAWSDQRQTLQQRETFTEWEVRDASGAVLLSLREAQPLPSSRSWSRRCLLPSVPGRSRPNRMRLLEGRARSRGKYARWRSFWRSSPN